MENHIHDYKFDAEFNNNTHTHSISGYTDYMIGITPFHYHYFSGISTCRKHTHAFSGYTGLPIKTENGHIHRIEGTLKQTAFHNHKFNYFTNEEVAYHSSKQYQKVYI